MFLTGLAVGLAGCAAWTAMRCWYRVDEGHLAVLTTFGVAEHEAGDPKRLVTARPGFHGKLPWQRVHDVSMMEQDHDLAGKEGGCRAMAADGTVLRFDSILRLVPVESELYHYLFGLTKPLDHVTGLFTCLLRNETANFHPQGSDGIPEEGSYALIRRERKLLNQRIEAFCREQIGQRYGVKFSAVDLADILPPDELADALNAVMSAQMEADAAYARAEAESQQRILAADRGVEIAKARGVAAENEIVELCTFLEDLDRQKTLDLYTARRRAEVLAQSRTQYLRSN